MAGQLLVRGEKGVNRHSTEIVAKKMWRWSSSVLRPKKAAEDSSY